MSNIKNQIEKPAEGSNLSFFNTLSRRFNLSSSSIDSMAFSTSFGAKAESSLEDDFAASRPSPRLPPFHSVANQPKRNFPLLGGWGPSPAAVNAVPASAPTEIIVGGVTLAFPFPPYASQVCLANQMIRAFKLRKHALLESPTGTGE
jgi:hypothetical protein